MAIISGANVACCGPKLNPFRGILPYDELDYNRFGGRNDDVYNILQMLQNYSLMILSGKSGYGKSSLLQAGIIPAVRRSHIHREWPTLKFPVIVRDWGAFKKDIHKDLFSFKDIQRFIAVSIAGNYKKYIKKLLCSVETYATSIDVDAKELKSDFDLFCKALDKWDNPNDLPELLYRVGRECGGVLLVIDQMEEILRFGEDASWSLNEAIYELRKVDNLSILLSLRQEYVAELKPLEDRFGGLAPNRYNLMPLDEDDTVAAFNKAAEAVGAQIEENVVSKIIQRLNAENYYHKGIDLLALQTVFYDVWESLAAGATTVTLKSVNDCFFGDTSEDNLSNTDKPRTSIFNQALGRLLDTHFSKLDKDDDAKPWLRFLRRYMAVRIVPMLSSGGYKTSQVEGYMFERVFGAALTAAANASANPASGSYQGSYTKSVWENDDHGKVLASGLKREFHRMLMQLSNGDANILKPFVGFLATTGDGKEGEDTLWELTHDRLGDALIEWAKGIQNTFSDCKYAPLALQGVSPIVVDIDQNHKNCEASLECTKLLWRGCSVEPRDGNDGAPAEFDGVHFKQCDFKGTVFINCIFNDCEFDACILLGTIFINCEFHGGVFSNIQAGNSIGFFGTKFFVSPQGKPLVFDHCNLVQPTFSDTPTSPDEHAVASNHWMRLEATVVFCHTRIFMGRFEGLDPVNPCEKYFSFEPGCELSCSSWDKSVQGKIVWEAANSSRLRLDIRGNGRLNLPKRCTPRRENGSRDRHQGGAGGSAKGGQ